MEKAILWEKEIEKILRKHPKISWMISWSWYGLFKKWNPKCDM